MATTKWAEPLTPWMIDAMETLGFREMTPVQSSTIPLLAGNKDVVVEAVTGSGKTLAFVLPALIRLKNLPPLKMGEMNVVIISPTRELARQTHNVLGSIIELAPDPALFKTQLISGGSLDITKDVRNFLSSRPTIVVATPGRFLEFIKAQHIRTRAIDLLVLDEADRLLDLGMEQTVDTILRMMPSQKRVGLFSATMGAAIEHIVKTGMRNPIKVSVKSAKSTPDKLKIGYVVSSAAEKFPKVFTLVQQHPFSKGIVYLPTCSSVEFWLGVFQLFITDTHLFSMHGKLSQSVRLKALDKFIKSADRSLLLTTDVAARGLDIPGVDFVLQLDPPTDASMFVHRSGRTARAGRSGESVVFLNDRLEPDYVDLMRVRKVPMEEKIVELNLLTPARYIDRLQAWVKEDRGRHDQAVLSFVSYIRFYTKHSATSIFRVSELDIVAIGRSYGLLRLPRMPELKNVENFPENGWLIDSFSFDKYSYINAKLECARQAELAKREKGGDTAKLYHNNSNWSRKRERQQIKRERRELKEQKAIKTKAVSLPVSDSGSEVEEDWKEVLQNKKRKAASIPHFDF